MNWEEIKNKYPLSWNEFADNPPKIVSTILYNGLLERCEEIEVNGVGDIEEVVYVYQYRNLYDYFDGIGLLVIVEHIAGWAFYIEQYNNRLNWINTEGYKTNCERHFKTRQQAEYAAFKTAFEIRNKQLEFAKENELEIKNQLKEDIYEHNKERFLGLKQLDK